MWVSPGHWPTKRLHIYTHSVDTKRSSSGAVWKSRWTSWAPVSNKPTVSVDVKQHFSQLQVGLMKRRKCRNDLSCMLHLVLSIFIQK